MIITENKRGNEQMYIEGQAMHWLKDKIYKKEKKRFMIHYTEN